MQLPDFELERYFARHEFDVPYLLVTICSSGPSEVLATIGLRALDRVVERSRAIVDANLPLLDDFFARSSGALEWVRPAAGPIGFPRLTVTGSSVEDFCDELRRDAGVLLLPGRVCGDDRKHFRIGFGRRDMPEALARLEAHLEPRARGRARPGPERSRSRLRPVG